MDFQIPELWVPAIAAFIPIITGLVTKLQSGSSYKQIVAIVLSVSVGVINMALADGGGDFENLASGFITAFGAQLAAYLGLLNNAARKATALAPEWGLGSSASTVVTEEAA